MVVSGAAIGATGDFLERAIEMSKAKADVLAIDTAHIRFIPADFTTDPIAEPLTAAGLDPARPALFLFEGVAVYLDPDVVARVLAEFRAVASAFGPRVRFIARDPGHDFIAVHGRSGIFRRDEKVLFARLLARKKSITGLVNMQRAGNQIRFRRNHVAILANARDLSGLFHLPKQGIQPHLHSAPAAEGFSQFDIVERAIFRRAQQAQDLFAELLFLIV